MITPTTAGIALVIALVVFGPGKLPEVGRAIGRGIREFKKATQGLDDDETKTAPPPADPAKQAASEAEAVKKEAPPVSDEHKVT